MSSTTFNLKNINFMSESKYDSLTEIHDDELYAVKFDINSCNLLDFKWSDHILNDMSWVRADTFSWQSGDLYKSAYEHLVEDFNNSTQKIDGLVDWEQPVLTSNTTTTEFGNVVVTASGNYSGYDAWKCMNGIKSGTSATTGWGTNNSNTGWIKIVFPYKLLVTGLRGYQRYDSTPANANTIGRFYTSSDKTTPIGDEYRNATSTNWNAVDVTGIPSEGIITDTIYFEKTSSTYGGFGELEITAKRVVGGVVEYYLAEDGHKIVLPDMEATVQAIYEETGVAWYYILDVANKRFKLPRTKWGFVGIRDTVGNYVPESLPNVTGELNNACLDRVATSGAFRRNSKDSSSGYGGSSYTDTGVDFDASRSSSAYQDNAPVQQRATQMYLYFYVGNYTQSAIEQTAGVTTEVLNDKLDTDLGNATATTKETVVGWGMPDYNSAISIMQSFKGSTYTVQNSGFYILYVAKNTESTSKNISVNGIPICIVDIGAAWQGYRFMIELSTGDVLSASSGVYNAEVSYYIPYKM